MSRRAAIAEIDDEFDDDTDLPLPTRLPNTGSRGALLEEIGDEMSIPMEPTFHPPLPGLSGLGGFPPSMAQSSGPHGATMTADTAPYKLWTCVYPIYIDAKRTYGNGQRRISLEKSVWWPKSEDIALAVRQLGLSTLHEPQRSHPQDWENPGRVKVLWKKDGKLMNPAIKTKKALFERIAAVLTSTKPELAVDLASLSTSTSTPAADPTSSSDPATAASTSTPSKSAATGGQSKGQPKPRTKSLKNTKRRAPSPQPPIKERISSLSPAIESGILVDAIKAGMNAMSAAEGGPGGTASGSGAGGAAGQGKGGKGKRQVIRVRQ